jgi:hypothetical protein
LRWNQRNIALGFYQDIDYLQTNKQTNKQTNQFPQSSLFGSTVDKE